MTYIRVSDRPMPSPVLIDEKTTYPRHLIVECGIPYPLEIVARSTILEMAGNHLCVKVHVLCGVRLWPGDILRLHWSESDTSVWSEIVYCTIDEKELIPA